MPKILLTDPSCTIMSTLQQLLPNIELDMVPTTSKEDFIKHAGEAEVLIVQMRQINAELLQYAPKVRLIQRIGVGYDNLDLPALKAAHIMAAITPGNNAVAVAEQTILLMLAVLKQAALSEESTRQGEWIPGKIMQHGIGDLAGATVGLIGFGNIARAVATRLTSFGVNLLCTSRQPLSIETEERFKVRRVNLDELLTGSHIVSLHIPLNPTTNRLINENSLAKMQRGSYIINTGRGNLIDEDALRKALLSGHIRGAGLDVLINERPGGNPFADLPQVFITPHVGGGSNKALRQGLEMVAANVVRYLEGEMPLHLL